VTVGLSAVWVLRRAPKLHYHRELEGVANHVATTGERAFLAKARRAVRERALLVATGRPGTGKTHAVAMLLETFPHAIYLAVRPSMTAPQVMKTLFVALNDEGATACPSYLEGDPLDANVEELVTAQKPILVIDDANFLGDKLIEEFIFLQTYGEFPLLILGHGLDALIRRNEALDSRVTHRHKFRPLKNDTLWKTLAAYHPCLGLTEREVLAFLDRRYAHGRFRCWATILQKALTLFPAELGTGLTSETAKRILYDITGHQSGDVERPVGRAPR
jgi:hypothetical protein